MIQELVALANGQIMGRVLWDAQKDYLSFVYDLVWQESPQAYPLSLSMPLTAHTHKPAVIEPFLWGLLPDNDEILRRWGQRFQVSPRNPFKLLSHVGEDCAGAVQLVKLEAVDKYLTGASQAEVEWLTDEQVAQRMEILRRDESAGRTGGDTGQFSLAGAQAKTAYYYDPEKDRWGIPSGLVPTTHIFKPTRGSFRAYAENEHFCLRLAQELGLPAASSALRYFNDIPVIVVERYDRYRQGARVIRIHQEDTCQALGRIPQQKYQNEGGPSSLQIYELIRDWSSDPLADQRVFVQSLVFNWLILGTDGHAKNYSVLISPNSQVRLAPLYDIASALPYPESFSIRKVKLAMKIGGQYLVSRIRRNEWLKFATEHQLDPSWMEETLVRLATQLPKCAEKIYHEMQNKEFDHPFIENLVRSLSARARECLSQI